MRIALLGPVANGGGSGGIGRLLLLGMLDHGAEVDFYTNAKPEELPSELHGRANLRIVYEGSSWEWQRWYSRTHFGAFVSGMAARVRAYNRLIARLVEGHRARAYDCVLQLSQTELFAMRRHLHELPPIVVYPFVHAGGELRWHRRESRYARRGERAVVHYLVRGYLAYRSVLQRRELKRPALVLGMSKRFNELVEQDYALDPTRLRVLYHPMPLDERGNGSAPTRREGPLTLLYVSRISVRKGVEQVIELSKRLDDLAGAVQIRVIGGRTLWSDYTAHLRDLNPRIATYLGTVPHAKVIEELDEADALLLPSRYEPGGLVVGEALSRGAAVVASDEVGSAEPIADAVCRRFPAGDMDAFERATRDLIADLRRDRAGLDAASRAEIRRHFDVQETAQQLLGYLREAAASRAAVPAR